VRHGSSRQLANFRVRAARPARRRRDTVNGRALCARSPGAVLCCAVLCCAVLWGALQLELELRLLTSGRGSVFQSPKIRLRVHRVPKVTYQRAIIRCVRRALLGSLPTLEVCAPVRARCAAVRGSTHARARRVLCLLYAGQAPGCVCVACESNTISGAGYPQCIAWYCAARASR
jgi:hypothetical protein